VFGLDRRVIGRALRVFSKWVRNLAVGVYDLMGMDDTIINRIAFGSVKELEELYQQ
jgi:hypothetical protein